MTIYNKILIVRLSAVGDVINVLPALKVLRSTYPKAHISWLVEDRAKDILENNPDLDEVFVFPRKRWQKDIKSFVSFLPTLKEAITFFKNIRSNNFDLIIDFHGNFKSGLMTMFSGKCVKLGFDRKSCKEWNHLFTNRHASLVNKRIHRIDKNLSLLKLLEIDNTYLKTDIIIPNSDKTFIDDFLSHNIAEDKQLAVIHPGTSKFGEFKRWPAEKYAKLADMLINKLNMAVLFTWGGSEIEIVNNILSFMHEKATISCKTQSLKQLAELINRSNIFISGDTGPMHIASIMEKRQVAIFGPKDPIIYGPYLLSKNLNPNTLIPNSHHKTTRLVRKDLPCSPCKKRKCKQNVCIKLITPDEVFFVCKELMTKIEIGNS